MEEKNKENQKYRNIDQLDVGRLTEALAAAEHISKKALYWHNFVRGIFFGAGSLLGATVVIAILVWVLSLLDSTPIIGPLINNTTHTIKKDK